MCELSGSGCSKLVKLCGTRLQQVRACPGRCIGTISRIRSGHRRCHRPSKWAKRAQIGPFCGHNHFWWLQTGGTVWNKSWQALGGILGPGPRLPMARTLHLWPIWGLFQPLWPPGTAIPGPKIGSSRSAWMYAIPFQPCSKLCHPFRVTTAAYGQNTAFMAIFGTFWP